MWYKDYVAVLSQNMAVTGTPHLHIDHTINLNPDINVRNIEVYNTSKVNMKTLNV